MCNAFIGCQELGVIQGSITGPLLFDIYSSDFARMCSSDESTLYAEDTVLVCAGTILEELTDHVNNTGLQKNFPRVKFQSSISFSPAEYEYESHFFPSRLFSPKNYDKVQKSTK